MRVTISGLYLLEARRITPIICMYSTIKRHVSCLLCRNPSAYLHGNGHRIISETYEAEPFRIPIHCPAPHCSSVANDPSHRRPLDRQSTEDRSGRRTADEPHGALDPTKKAREAHVAVLCTLTYWPEPLGATLCMYLHDLRKPGHADVAAGPITPPASCLAVIFRTQSPISVTARVLIPYWEKTGGYPDKSEARGGLRGRTTEHVAERLLDTTIGSLTTTWQSSSSSARNRTRQGPSSAQLILQLFFRPSLI